MRRSPSQRASFSPVIFTGSGIVSSLLILCGRSPFNFQLYRRCFSVAHDTAITRIHLVSDCPSPPGVTANDIWCDDVPVTHVFHKWKVAPLRLSPSPGALTHSLLTPASPPPPPRPAQFPLPRPSLLWPAPPTCACTPVHWVHSHLFLSSALGRGP